MNFTDDANEFQPEQLLGGRYRVLSVLGRGGMGVVYKVEHIYLGLELALKTINSSSLTDASVRRFQAEARAVFALNHPNVISVHDFGLLDENTPFLAMELVEGTTLAAQLKHRVLTLDEAIPIFIQVCSGLAHAHEHGVIHRDIKPGNIMLLAQLQPGTEGSVKILDFGIAKMTEVDREGEIQSLTRTGEIFGSPLYMSPEQCSGGKVDHRSDIYSLGCVIFEALTGTTPFVGESALSTMMMHQSGIIPSLKEASLGTDFSEQLEQFVQSMLAKNPNNRYQNLNDAARDLAAAGRGEELPHNPAAQSRPSLSSAGAKTNTIRMRRRMLFALVAGNVFFSAALGATCTKLFTTSRNTTGSGQVRDVTREELPDFSQEFSKAVKLGKCAFEEKAFITDKSLAVFENYDGVQSLNLRECTVTDDGLAALKKSPVLNLTLYNCNIGEVKNIAKLDHLQYLELRGTFINDSALPQLAKLKMLTTLGLRSCDITAEGLKQLIPSTSLLNVQLSPGKFSKETIAELSEKMPQCIFEGYTGVCKSRQILAKKFMSDPYQANAEACAAAQKANPRLSIIADFLGGMSLTRSLHKKYSEAEVLLAKARNLLEKNGNRTALAVKLMDSAVLTAQQGHMAECDSYADQSAKMSIETMMHNSAALMERLDYLTNFAVATRLYDKAIENSKRAVELIKQQAPSEADRFLPGFLEKVGRYYYIQQKPEQALPYLREHLAVCKSHRDKDAQSYARALLELEHCEPDRVLRKQLCQEGLDLLDKLGNPSAASLREHYCDACMDMIVIYDEEKNLPQSLQYARRALAVANTIEKDWDGRKPIMQKQLIRLLIANGRDKEAKQDAAAFNLPWNSINK